MRILVAGGTGTAGRVIVRRAAAAGHTVRVVSRSAGGLPEGSGAEYVAGDLRTGAGLAGAMDGVDAVIDASNVGTPFYRTASTFFVDGTQHLVAAERRAGVGHHVVLSIAGMDRINAGYYRAKLDQERVARREAERAGVGCSIARVSQFHDFAALIFQSYRLGPMVLAPPLHLQPVHLDDVAEHLLQAATHGAATPVRDLIGPRPEELPDMLRRYGATQPDRVRMVPMPLPPSYRRANEAGDLKPADSVRGTKTFDQWLDELTA